MWAPLTQGSESLSWFLKTFMKLSFLCRNYRTGFFRHQGQRDFRLNVANCSFFDGSHWPLGTRSWTGDLHLLSSSSALDGKLQKVKVTQRLLGDFCLPAGIIPFCLSLYFFFFSLTLLFYFIFFLTVLLTAQATSIVNSDLLGLTM